MFSPFPIFQYILEWGNISSTSSVNSFPILFSGLPFATHVASITLAAYHPLLAPLVPGWSWKGISLPEIRPSKTISPLLSRAWSIFIQCSGSHKIFCVTAGSWGRGSMLGPLLPSSCSTEITEFLARGPRFFTVLWVMFNDLRLVNWINASWTLSDRTFVVIQGAEWSFTVCVFLHQIFLVPHVNCINFIPQPLWLCHYMVMLRFCAHLEVPDLVSNFGTLSLCVSGLWKELRKTILVSSTPFFHSFHLVVCL